MASMPTDDCSVRTGPGAPTTPIPWKAQVEIVIPVRNEERDLGPAVRRLRAYCDDCFPFTARITIADNGSTDRTCARAQGLAGELPLVRAARIKRPGRGGALRSIWSGSDADVVAYMDVDLSTDLNALLPLVAPLVSGHSDVAIGTRLARGSRVVRGPKHEILSRCYNLLLHASLGTRFSDAQCGFKAVRADTARVLLPLTTDTGWFFDTELLVLAERAGLRIHEVPVDWIDDPDSRVSLVATALGDLRGILRLGAGLARGTIVVPELRGAQPQPPGEYAGTGARGGPGSGTGGGREGGPARTGPRPAAQLVSFVLIGVASTVAYVLLYLLLRGALATLHASAPQAGRTAELTVVVAANLTATLVRFGLYRTWVFRHPRPGSPPGHGVPPRPPAPADHEGRTARAVPGPARRLPRG